MTQPNCFNTTVCPYSYTLSAGITDVNTVISDIRTALVTGLNWTEPSTALFKTPLNDGGQWFDVLLTRITATKLEMRLRDQFGHTICTRRIEGDATTDFAYYCSKYTLFIESKRATSEILQAIMPDPTPNTYGDYPFVVYGTGYKTTGDAVDSQGSTVGQLFAWDDTAAAFHAYHFAYPTLLTGGTSITRTTGSLAFFCDDVAMFKTSAAWTARTNGRLWHAYWIDNTVAFQTDKTMAVSDAASATFRVIGLAGVNNARLALRKSG